MATIDTIADRSTGSAIAGKAYFETSTNKFIVFNGTVWIELDSDGVGAVYQNRWGASFDGTDDYVMTSGSPVDMGDMASGYTFSAWMWREDVPSLPSNGGTTSWYGAPYATADTAPNYNTLKWYITDEYWNGGVYKRIRWYHGTQTIDNTSILIPKGVWCHLAATWDGSNTVTTYLNGTQLGQITNASTLTNRADEMLIGKGNWYHKGLVDEVAYWNTGLSSSDITAIYNSGVPDDLSSYSPVGYWRMGDDSNDSATSGGSIATITDSSGNGNDATQGTASSQPTFKALDQSTTSLSFDGSGDYLEKDFSSAVAGGAFTFSLWYKVNVYTNFQTVFESADNPGSYADGWRMMVENNGALKWWSGAGGSYSNPLAMPLPATGAYDWNHIVVTKSTTGAMSLYYNGNTTAVDTGTNTATPTATHLRVCNTQYMFNGKIDEVSFFNSELTGSDLTALIQTSRGAHIKNDLSLSPLAYWRMGEDDSLTDGQTGIAQISDASGNGNHATQATASAQPTASVDPVIYV